MKNIGYPDTKNKLGGSSPLYATDPDKKKKKAKEVTPAIQHEVSTETLQEKLPQDSPHENESSNADRQNERTQVAAARAEREKAWLDKKYGKKTTRKVGRQQRKNINAEVNAYKKKLQAEAKAKKMAEKNKRKK